VQHRLAPSAAARAGSNLLVQFGRSQFRNRQIDFRDGVVLFEEPRRRQSAPSESPAQQALTLDLCRLSDDVQSSREATRLGCDRTARIAQVGIGKDIGEV